MSSQVLLFLESILLVLTASDSVVAKSATLPSRSTRPPAAAAGPYRTEVVAGNGRSSQESTTCATG